MSFKSTLKACSQKASLYMLSVLFIASLTFPLAAMADMLPPNWDKMSGKEKETYFKAKSEQRKRLQEAYLLRQKAEELQNKGLVKSASDQKQKASPEQSKATNK